MVNRLWREDPRGDVRTGGCCRRLEWHEPDESRGSRPDLWEPGGEIPPGHPANRLSSGSYIPPPVRAVEIPKKGGSSRTLGVPTVIAYREVVQTVFGFVGGQASVSSLVRGAA